MGVARRVDDVDVLSACGYGCFSQTMVVPAEYKVDAGDASCRLERGVLVSRVACDSAFEARMEEADDDVCLLRLADMGDPFACRCDDVEECHALPQRFVEPIRDCRGEHSYEGYARSVDFANGIRLETGPQCGCVDDVGRKDFAVDLAHVFVVNGTACLDVVVAYRLNVVAHVVQYLGGYVGQRRVYVVGVVAGGLSLQHIAAVDEQQSPAILLA